MLDDAMMTAADSAVATEPTESIGDDSSVGTVTETTAVGDESPETQVTETQETTETTSTEETSAPPTDATQPVVFPDAVRKLQANKELMANPLVAEAFKAMQSAYGRLNDYTLHFPTVADAKKFAEAFPGGLNDALSDKQEADKARASDDAFYSRDRKQIYELASTWQQDDPEAYRVLLHEGLMNLMDRDPEGFREVALELLEGSLGQMQQAAFQRNDQESAGRISQVHQDIFGRKPGESARVDPRDRQFKEREAAFQRQQAEFTGRVAASFMETSNDIAADKVSVAVRATVNQVLKNSKVTSEQKDKLASEIYDDINLKLRADKSLQSQIQSIVGSGKRTGKFSKEDQDRYSNAIYAKAQSILRSTGPQFISNWTKTFLNMKQADTNRRVAAGNRTDLTGGGSPNFGSSMLTGAQLLDMTDKQLMEVPRQLIPKNATELMREERARRSYRS
jgi:hypothetical protein